MKLLGAKEFLKTVKSGTLFCEFWMNNEEDCLEIIKDFENGVNILDKYTGEFLIYGNNAGSLTFLKAGKYKEVLIDNIGIEDFNNLNFEVIPDDEALIQEPYELVHYKNYEKLLNTTKVMFYNRNNADNYYFKTKQGRYISLNA